MATQSINRARLLESLTRDEAYRQFAYRDTEGKLTVGIGRNLEDKGITTEEALYLLLNDVGEAEADLDRFLPWWRDMSGPRQEVLLNMRFNMGLGNKSRGLLSFQKTLAHMKAGRYEQAAQEMLSSRWAKQVKGRADRLARQMETGIPQ